MNTNNDPTYEELIDELTKKLEKFYEWAKKTNQRIADLEARDTTPVQKDNNLVNARLWTPDEEQYLVRQMEPVSHKRTALRPKLLELEQTWENLFGYPRTYDALRKKWKRLTA